MSKEPMELASRREELRSTRDPAAFDAEARAAAGGDVAAFERFYRATVARVHTSATRLLGPQRADEATQEVYLRVWRALPGWRGEASATTWLHRLALNTLINLDLRARRAAPRADEEALAGREARRERPGLRLDLERAIAGLPARSRLVFVLHDVEGHAHQEIAALLSISVETSKSQLHRARLLLRASLGEGTES